MHACIWWTVSVAIDLFKANAHTSFAYTGLFFFFFSVAVVSVRSLDLWSINKWKMNRFPSKLSYHSPCSVVPFGECTQRRKIQHSSGQQMAHTNSELSVSRCSLLSSHLIHQRRARMHSAVCCVPMKLSYHLIFACCYSAFAVHALFCFDLPMHFMVQSEAASFSNILLVFFSFVFVTNPKWKLLFGPILNISLIFVTVNARE